MLICMRQNLLNPSVQLQGQGHPHPIRDQDLPTDALHVLTFLCLLQGPVITSSPLHLLPEDQEALLYLPPRQITTSPHDRLLAEALQSLLYLPQVQVTSTPPLHLRSQLQMTIGVLYLHNQNLLAEVLPLLSIPPQISLPLQRLDLQMQKTCDQPPQV